MSRRSSTRDFNQTDNPLSQENNGNGNGTGNGKYAGDHSLDELPE